MLASLSPPSPQLISTLDTALVSGGDARLLVDPHTGVNRYACSPRPDPGLLDFASATASVISSAAWRHVEERYYALAPDAAGFSARWQKALAELRAEIGDALGATQVPGCRTLLAPSGTDLHTLALDAVLHHGRPVTVLLPDPAETGSGVPAALQSRLGVSCQASLSLRMADGEPRAVEEWQAHADTCIEQALANGGAVLLLVLDVSKTGLMVPSAPWVLGWLAREPQRLHVLVDACQMRMSPSHVAAWLQAGAMVAVTGSKFLAGPSFSGALFLPPQYQSSHAEQVLTFRSEPNVGLLLRWWAALFEWRRFIICEPGALALCLNDFARALQTRLSANARVQLLPHALPQRQGLAHLQTWEALPSIFALRLRQGGRPLTPEAVRALYGRLPLSLACQGPLAARVHLGQAVDCPNADGSAGAVLRLCLSARQLASACTHQQAFHALWHQTEQALDKLEALLR